MNKLKLLWLGLVPIGWYLAFLLVKWVQYYPVDCSTDDMKIGLCMFLFLSGLLGSALLMVGSIGLAVMLILED